MIVSVPHSPTAWYCQFLILAIFMVVIASSAVLFSLIMNNTVYIFMFGLLNIVFLWNVHSKILPIFKNWIPRILLSIPLLATCIILVYILARKLYNFFVYFSIFIYFDLSPISADLPPWSPCYSSNRPGDTSFLIALHLVFSLPGKFDPKTPARLVVSQKSLTQWSLS